MKRILSLLLCAALLSCAVVFPACAQSFTGIEINVPSFGYGVTIYWYQDNPASDALSGDISDLFFKAYPAMRETYGTSDNKQVKIFLWDASTMPEGVPAYSSGGEIHCSRQFLEADRGNLNCIVHELFHVVQNGYPGREENDTIHVLCEGLADVVRYDLSVYEDPAWSLPAYAEGQSFMDSYTVTAAFLVWARDKFDDALCIRLNRILHEGGYGDHVWPHLTGYSLDELWAMYASGE